MSRAHGRFMYLQTVCECFCITWRNPILRDLRWNDAPAACHWMHYFSMCNGPCAFDTTRDAINGTRLKKNETVREWALFISFVDIPGLWLHRCNSTQHSLSFLRMHIAFFCLCCCQSAWNCITSHMHFLTIACSSACKVGSGVTQAWHSDRDRCSLRCGNDNEDTALLHRCNSALNHPNSHITLFCIYRSSCVQFCQVASHVTQFCQCVSNASYAERSINDRVLSWFLWKYLIEI